MNRVKKVLALLLLVLCTIELKSQSETIKKYSDLLVFENFDSLKKISLVQKNNYITQFNTLASLEKSRLKYYSCDFGTDLLELENLAAKINTKAATIVLLHFKIEYKKSKETVKTEIIDDINKLRELAIELNDFFEIANSDYNSMTEIIDNRYYDEIPFTRSDSFLIKQYYHLVIEAAQKNKSNDLFVLQNIASIDYNLALDESSHDILNCCNNLLKFIDTSKSYKYIEGYVYNCLSLYFSKIDKFDLAISWAKKCLSTLINKCSTAKAQYLYSIANCYFLANNDDSAKKYFELSLKNIQPGTTALLTTEICYDRLSLINFYKKKYQLAFNQLYLRDSLFYLRVKKQKEDITTNMEHKYAFEKNKTKILSLESQRSRFIKYTIAAFIVALVILFLSLLLYRQNVKIKKLNLFRNKIQSVISHDLRSPLYSLQQLYLQANYLIKKNNLNDLKKISDSIDFASTNIGNLLDNLLLWSKQNKLGISEKINLSSCINDVLQLYTNIADAKNIAIENNIDNGMHLYSNKNVLSLVIRNWIDNVLKHANPSNICVNAFYVNNNIEIVVEDDGIITEGAAKKINTFLSGVFKEDTLVNSGGLGLLLIHYFASNQNWTINLESSTNKNTFFVVIPNCTENEAS